MEVVVADPGTRFWIGASTLGALGSAARGIRPLDVSADGGAVIGDPVDVGENPMFLAWRDTRTLAIAHELDEGLVSTWTVDDARLVPLGAASGTGPGAAPCHVAFTPSGERVFAANYGGGRLSLHDVHPVAALVAAIDFTGAGPDRERQDAPHPHQAVVDHARGRLLVPDLGTDRLRVIPLPGSRAELAHRDADDIAVHPGAGPRHLVITGHHAIVANELDRTASIVDLTGEGEVAWFAVDPSVEARGHGVSAIRLTRHGVVLIGDRDADALVALRLDPDALTLEHIATMPTGGRHPRDLELTHDERFALVADQASDSIAVIALEDGVPARVVTTIDTPAPACLARVPLG